MNLFVNPFRKRILFVLPKSGQRCQNEVGMSISMLANRYHSQWQSHRRSQTSKFSVRSGHRLSQLSTKSVLDALESPIWKSCKNYLKKITKIHYCWEIFKKFKTPALTFRRFGRKIQILGKFWENFEIFWWKFNRTN